MDSLQEDPILKFHPDTLVCVRQAYDLDNPARMEEAVNILEEWVKKQNHFTQKTLERGYLERAIITGKGSIERAKSQIDSLCTFRTLLPIFFADCCPRNDLDSILPKAWLVPLPKLTKDHHRVWIIKVNTSDIKPRDLLLFYRWLITTAEYTKRHDYLNGVIIIIDYRNISILDLISKVNVSEVREIATILIKGFGARLKQIHVINESQVMEFITKFFGQIVSRKIISRIKLHHEPEAIHEYIDLSILPVEYGGTERSLDALRNEWIDVLSSEDHMDYVKKMNQAKTDETNRVEERFNSLYMGTPGSFRHLVVD